MAAVRRFARMDTVFDDTVFPQISNLNYQLKQSKVESNEDTKSSKKKLSQCIIIPASSTERI